MTGPTRAGPPPRAVADVAGRPPAAGDTDWLAQAAQPHLAALHSRALHLTSNPQSADDLLQDTLERGYRKRHLFRPGTDVRAWLFRIMHNVWISQHRHRATAVRTISFERLDARTWQCSTVNDATDTSIVETAAMDELSKATILRSIATLPTPFRDVMLLADVYGATHHDIATLLRIPAGSVRSRLFRARRRLRDMLRAE